MSGKAQYRLDILLGILLFAGMSFALYMALIGAPTERTMGDLQRIFYFHVPAAITGLAAFATNFVSSLVFLLRKNRRWDALALASAELGILFFCMVLVTGPIWAKPVWFVWWTWSPRLTASFILCLLYVAYMLIRKSYEDPERKASVSAVFGVIAFVDAPLVWFSIRWWRDIHPSPMLETGGLDPSMRPAFYACLGAFLILFLYLLRRRFCLETMRNKVDGLLLRLDEMR
ncbi:MAG: cytochrome c biogenesis protein CcsA [Acidobacteria bacterium]|nr:cytochrome c biogenesis protein CcsA [Acidobacteriota bacterium]